jgi:hypothetical protein
VPLIRAPAKLGASTLIDDLHRTERRAITIHEDRFDVTAVNRRVRLNEEPEKQILGERLVGFRT